MTVPAYGFLAADVTECVLTPTGASGRVNLADAIQTAVSGAPITISNLTNVIATLPTSEPMTSGVLWINGGVIQLS